MFEQQHTPQPIPPAPQRPQPSFTPRSAGMPMNSSNVPSPAWQQNVGSTIPVSSTPVGTTPASQAGSTSMPNPTGSLPPPTSVQRVYTMPEKFLPPTHERRTHHGKRWLLISLIVLIIAAAVIAALVYVFQHVEQQVVPTTNATTNATTGTGTGNTNTNGSANTNTSATNGSSTLNPPLNTTVNQELAENVNEDLFPGGTTGTTNENSNTNASTNTADSVTASDHSTVPDASDKDKDKLTDEEEEQIYTTKATLPDTDKDGYVDGTEIQNLYSPINADGTKLRASGLVIEHKSKEFQWSILYPAKWLVEPIDEQGKEVLFTPDTIEGEFIQVVVAENPEGQTAAEWYVSRYTNVDPEDLETVELGGLEGVVSTDELTYYLATNNAIIGIIYNIGTSERLHFRTTFAMMAESFVYTAKKKKEENNEEAGETTTTEE